VFPILGVVGVTENRGLSNAYQGAGAMENAKDPTFWITMTIGFSPILLGALILFWFV